MKTMNHRTISITEGNVPCMLYGTAWKEQETQRLTELALLNGFRGIDTANQRRHYFEAAVGQAIATSIERDLLARSDLFLQTKFTFQRGQDHRLPYDPTASVGKQVEQSFISSCEHLGTDIIDSYLLHGPTQDDGLTAADWEAWRSMESLHDQGRVRYLGISNVSLEQLQSLCDRARVRPRFVQNRCYSVRGWDRDIRVYCNENEMIYQGFSLLTANRNVLGHPEMVAIATRHKRTVAQVVFRFALEVGMMVLTGTTNELHMRNDLDIFQFQLTPEEIARIERMT
jgi:diketogulonate reductase-like aldo/keto reductase